MNYCGGLVKFSYHFSEWPCSSSHCPLSLSPSSFFLFLSIKMLLTFYNKLNINSTDNDCMIVIAGHDRKRLVQ